MYCLVTFLLLQNCDRYFFVDGASQVTDGYLVCESASPRRILEMSVLYGLGLSK